MSLQKKVSRWILRARAAAETLKPGAAAGPHASHRLLRSGNVIWCSRCGTYSTARGMGLARPCTGPVPSTAVGGRAQQLRQLKKGRHPKRHHRLPPAVPYDEEPCPPSAGETPRMRTDDIGRLSQTAFGRLQLRVRRREFFGRAGADIGAAGDGTTAEPAAPSLAAKRRAELVQQLFEAASGPADTRPAKRLRSLPSVSPGMTGEPPAPHGVTAASVPVAAPSAAARLPQASPTLHPRSAASAPEVAPSASARVLQAPPAAAVRAKRHRSHPALCRSRLAPLPAGLSSPSAPAASAGRADMRWGRCGSERSELDSDDGEAGAKRVRASASTPQAWRPPLLPRRGDKRTRKPSSAGATAQPRSPSGARGQRRRTG